MYSFAAILFQSPQIVKAVDINISGASDMRSGTVAVAVNNTLPSEEVSLKNDGSYHNVYHGEEIIKPTSNTIITQNIAIDNEAQQTKENI